MGNRYGRRQRRKHREMIASLERQNIGVASRLNSAWGEVAAANARVQRFKDAMERWDQEVRYLLGRYSALRFSSEAMSKVPGRMEISEPLSAASLGPMEMDDRPIEYRIEMMLCLLHEIEEPYLSEMRRLLRVEVRRLDWNQSTGNAAAYAFSERLWRDLTSREAVESGATARFCQETAEQFMALLAQYEQKPKRKAG